jgi:hypothetical protein
MQWVLTACTFSGSSAALCGKRNFSSTAGSAAAVLGTSRTWPAPVSCHTGGPDAVVQLPRDRTVLRRRVGEDLSRSDGLVPDLRTSAGVQ